MIGKRLQRAARPAPRPRRTRPAKPRRGVGRRHEAARLPRRARGRSDGARPARTGPSASRAGGGDGLALTRATQVTTASAPSSPIAEAYHPSVRGAPLQGGGRAPQPKPSNAKGVTRSARRRVQRARRAHRGPWCARSSPRGPTRRRAQRGAYKRVGGWVSPPGDSFSGGGASEGGVQGGKPRRGRRGAPFATTTTAIRAGGG